MSPDARRALRTIRRCVASGRYRLTRHFRVRLAERGVLWPDVLTVFDEPDEVRADGLDDADRERWIVTGPAADGSTMTLVCAIGRASDGTLTVFVTVYWDA